MNCVIQYSKGGKLLNFYTKADSIEQAEAKAAQWGIVGEGFEIVEAIDG
jgi:hypothetical protein